MFCIASILPYLYFVQSVFAPLPMFSLEPLGRLVLLPNDKGFAAAGLVLFGVVLLTAKSYLHRRWSKLPPGPIGLPIVGNALSLLGHWPWLKFTEWKEKYGE